MISTEIKLATKACNLVTSVSEEDLREMLVILAENPDHPDRNLYLSALYAQFMPKTVVKLSDKKWLAKASSKKEGVAVAALKYVYQDGPNCVACDGHRLHVVKGKIYPLGSFTKNNKQENCESSYPDYKRTIPTHENRAAIRLCELKKKITVIPNKKSDSKGQPFFIHFEYNGMKYYFSRQYWDEACAGFDNAMVYIGSNMEALLIEGFSKLAVIMPVNA